MKKNIKQKTLLKKLLDIKKYDISHFSGRLQTKVFQKENDISFSDEKTLTNLKYINENFYTFQSEPPKTKSLYFFRKIIFNFLFKYSFRQVKFNDHLRNLLSIIVEKLDTNSKMIDGFKNEILELNEKVSNLLEVHNNDVNELNYDKTWKSSMLNALEEKIEILENNKITNSNYRHFSQFGEDEWIVKNIDLPKKGTYLDVGTADGVTFSNTYYFEKKGWDGICFEPDPNNFIKAKRYRNNVINIAVSNKNETVDFYISDVSSDWSGLKPTDKYTEKIKIKCQTLSKIIDDNKISQIDLLSIDTEGTEIDVWNSLDLNKIRPKIVIAEFNNQGKINQKLFSVIEKSGYKLVHKTYANYIFINDKK